MRRIYGLLGALAGAAALASCGGGGGGTGGGGGVIPPGGGGVYVQATPAPGLQQAPATLCVTPVQNAQTVSVSSNPQQAWVEVTSAGTTYVLGQTPVSCHVNPTLTGVTVTVLGNVGQAPQTTAVAGNVSTSVFFNAIADSSGSVAAGSGTLSVGRAPSSTVRSTAGALRRALRRAPQGANVVPGVFSVVYRSGALAMEGRSAADVERSLGVQGREIGTFAGMTWRGVHVAPAQAAALQAQLQARSDVAAVYPAHYRYRQSVRRPQDAAVLPNDTFMDPYDQWDMFRISTPQAWGITEGSTSVLIAIIDTGYDVNNPDLLGKVTYSKVDYTGTGRITASPAYEDTDGHGTNVSGIAAALTNNGSGFAGVGWKTPLLEFKIFADTDSTGVSCVQPGAISADCGASTTDEAAAITSAVSHGAKVISMSLGGPGPIDQTEYNAIQAALQKGVVVVAAAGNDGTSTGIEYPGGDRGVISVGASAIVGDSCTSGMTPCDASSGTEVLASYSDYGPTADALSGANTVNQPTLLAPGGGNPGAPANPNDPDNLHWIYNLYSTGDTTSGFTCNPSATGGVCSSFFVGTSQATPHVAGAVALMLAVNPSLTPAQVLNIFQNPNNDDTLNVTGQGAGRLNVLKALQAAGGSFSAGGPSSPPSSSFVAFAYTSGAGNRPTILDVQYPSGVPVNADGSFRLSDVPADVTYKVGVWIDTNHDGIVDSGDWFGVAGGVGSPSQFSSTGTYAYGTITVQQVTSGNFTLP
ncbi:hypothetical protein EPN44_08850 [bacterium]|nr:MAG: hypothetical protein EPN44_08850 [bacterium]